MMLLCGVALMVEDADDVACNAVSPPCADVDADALSQEPEPTEREAKQVTRERMATGSCVFDETTAPMILEMRVAGLPCRVLCAAALDAEAEDKLSMTTLAPGPASSSMTTFVGL
jgi:hypothetical protein